MNGQKKPMRLRSSKYQSGTVIMRAQPSDEAVQVETQGSRTLLQRKKLLSLKLFSL